MTNWTSQESRRLYAALKRREVTEITINHYGGSPPKCACCGENTYDFLTIDHIIDKEEDGRLTYYLRGSKLCADLIRRGFPEGYQVLCINCNFSKGKHGICVHKV